MRVYIPATFDDLDRSLRGELLAERAFAVTPRLLEISALEDDEELAEQVRDEAGMASIREARGPVRVVIVADCSRADVQELAGGHPAAVALASKIAVEDVVCAFVDELDAAQDASRALAGDEDALDALAQRDLLWWDASEFAQIPRPQ